MLAMTHSPEVFLSAFPTLLYTWCHLCGTLIILGLSSKVIFLNFLWSTTLADLVALFYCLHILSHCLKLTFVFFSALGHKYYGDRDLVPCVLRWISRPLVFQPGLEFCLAAFTPSLMAKGRKFSRDSKKLSHAQITFDYIVWVFPGRFCYPALNWWGWVCSQGVFMPYYPFICSVFFISASPPA